MIVSALLNVASLPRGMTAMGRLQQQFSSEKV